MSNRRVMSGGDQRSGDELGGPKITRQELAHAGLLALALTVLWRVISPLVGNPCCDANEYLRLAREPGFAVPRPYNTRVLVPWLVHLVGTEPTATFHAMTLACLAATGVFAYLLARHLGVGHAMALVALTGLLCSRGWVFSFAVPYLTDPAAYLLLSGLFLALVSDAGAWLIASLLVLLAGTREVFAGMAVPLYVWWRRRWLDPELLVRVLVLLAPALMTYLLLTQLTPSSASIFSLWPIGTALVRIVQGRLHEDGWLWPTTAFGMSLGMWLVLAVPSLGASGLRRLSWWLLPVFATFALGWDWSRFTMYAFPVVIPAGALTLERSSRRRLLLGLVAVQAFLPLLDLTTGNLALNYPGPSLPATLVVMLATAAVLLLDSRERRRHGDRPARVAA